MTILPGEWQAAAKEKIKCIPEEYRRARLRDLQWVGNIEWHRHGLLLSGGVGIGKTFVGTACAIDMLNPEHPKTVAIEDRQYSQYNNGRRFVYNNPCIVWVSVPVLLSKIRATYAETKTKVTEYSITKELTEASILFLDDLGAHRHNDYTATLIYTIISERRNARRFTIVTTNESIREFEKWCPRIGSRLAEFYPIILPNIDWRKNVNRTKERV